MRTNFQPTTFSTRLKKPDLARPLIVLGALTGVMWLVEVIDWLTGPLLLLDSWGIRPRDFDHLAGIAFAPLLHADFAHLAANTFPFLFLGALVYWRGEREFWLVTCIIVLLGGLGTWLIGPARSVHVGLSGVIFGYLGYLLLLGWIERSPASIFRAFLVGFLYGGVLWGVLPLQSGISWQGHLFGLLAGGLAAYWFGRRPRNLDREITVL